MARKTLSEIRDQLKKEAETGSKTFQSDNASYPFWSIPDDSTAVIRFLPDGDKENDTGFWVERLMINLDFSGIVGDSERNSARVQVPCIEMFGKQYTCPIQSEIKPWYKNPALEASANKYWKKRTFLYQGFVITHPGFVDKKGNPIEEDAPENPIRRYIINPDLHKLIRAILLDPDLERWPDDYERGLNFNIRKTKGVKWSNYDTSSWARKESALTEEQLNAIQKYKLFNLKEFLPRIPSETELKVMFEMFEASVNGEKYDPEKWASYYRPFGISKPDSDKPKSSLSQEPDDELETEKTVKSEISSESKTVSPSDRANDILSKIRARQKA